MATPAQAAAATVGAGSLAAAGSYGITQAVKGSSEESTTEEAKEIASDEKVPELEREPESKKLDTASDPAYSEKTLATLEANKPKLVNVKEESNKKWWDWAFKNKFKPNSANKDNLHEVFKSVDKEHDDFANENDQTKTSLNYACHKAYKKKYLDFEKGNHLLENIKLFCTPGKTGQDISEPEDEEPQNIALLSEKTTEASNYTSKLGEIEGNKSLLVAAIGTNTKSNDNWWKWVFKKHFLAKKADNNYTIDEIFSKVNTAYAANAVGDAANNETALNQACDEAYKNTVPISNKPNFEKNIKLFCAKGGSENTGVKFQNS